MNKEQFGVELVAITDKFKAKLNELKQFGQNVKQQFKEGWNMDGSALLSGLKDQEEQIKKEIEDIKNGLKEAQGLGFDNSGLVGMNNALQNAESRLVGVRAKIQEIENPSAFTKIGEGARNAANNIKESFSGLKERIKDALSPKNIFEKIKNGFSKVVSGIKNGAGKIKGFLNSIKSKAGGLGDSISKMGNKAVKSFKKFTLAIIGARSVIMGLRKAVSAYMAFDQQLNDTLSSAWAGLGAQLAPVIEYIINLFAKAISYINAFIKALSGINLIARANTKALNSQAGAAKSANKSLAGFDELNNINTDNGGGGGGGANQIELPEVDTSKLEDFANKLRDLFNKGEYFQIGEMIGQKISESLEKIPWDTIKTKAGNIGKGIAEFLNGGIEGTDWAIIGNTLAQSLNTVLEFAFNFVETFDFKKFGQSMGELFYNALHNIDWEKLATTIGDGIKGIFDSISLFFQEVDWGQLAKDLEKFFKKVDWSGVAKSIFEAIGSALGAAVSFLGQFIVDIWEDIKEYFGTWIEKSKEQGGNVIDGILAGIANAVVNIGQWIYDNVFKPFIDGFKKAFKIHSPSKVMEEQGTFIIDGLKQGLTGIWNAVKGIFENLYNKITGVFTDIKNKVKSIIGDLVQGIKDKFKNIGKAIGEAVTGAVKNAINGVLRQAVKIINGFISAINAIIPLINVIPGVKLSKLNKLEVPQLATGTNYVPEDQLAYIHKGEAVIPKKFNSAEYFNNYSNNDETNQLLRQLINVVDEKDMNVSLDGKQISQSTVNYINQQSRILGRSVV